MFLERSHVHGEAEAELQPKVKKPETLTSQAQPAALVRRAVLGVDSLAHRDVLQLQRNVGNRVTARLFSHTAQHQPVQKKENKTGLPDNLKDGIENLSGISMDDVKVHYNSDKTAGLQTLAYTQGSDIHVGAGQEKHLAHEAWHVVQQKQGRVKPNMQMKGAAINDDPSLEHEADVMGSKVESLGEQTGLRREEVEEKSGWARSTIQPTWAVNGKELARALLGFYSNPVQALVAAARGTELDERQTELLNTFSNMESHEGLNTLLSELVQSEETYEIQGVLEIVATRFPVAQLAAEDVEDSSIIGDTHSEDIHSDAPEEPVAWSDLELKEFSDKRDETLLNVFKNLAGDRIEGLTSEQFLSAYDQWYESGVMTRSRFNQLFQTPPLQMKRTPNTTTTQAEYTTENFGKFKDVTYKRDGKGNIDFTKALKYKTWRKPVEPSSRVELSTGSKSKTYGIMKNGTKIKIGKASRSQHFAVANRIKKYDGSGSPAKWTWHHLSKQYEMILVDRVVHAKHGHNGGFLLWK
jgi:hypothetical protein